MSKAVILFTTSFFLILYAKAQDASNQKTISVSTDIGFPLYNSVSSAQLTALFQGQFPLAKKFSITTATGVGFAFIKSYYKETVRAYYGSTVGLYLPIWLGGRYYIIKGLHSDLELGADIKLNRLMLSQFHFSPGVGYALPVGESGFLNFSTHYVTGFKRGSSSFDLRVGYMFSL